DRKHRVQQFSMGRKAVDRAIVGPVVRRLERSLLKRGSVLAASQYTRRLLDEIAGVPVVKDILSIPIDIDFFSPSSETPTQGVIGFSGRLDDPRKNLELLLAALRALRQRGHRVNALLIGGEPDQKVRRRIRDLGIGESIEFSGYLPVAS